MVGTWPGEGVGEEAEGQGRPGSRGHLGRQSRPGRGALAERPRGGRPSAAGRRERGPGGVRAQAPPAAGGRRWCGRQSRRSGRGLDLDPGLRPASAPRQVSPEPSLEASEPDLDASGCSRCGRVGPRRRPGPRDRGWRAVPPWARGPARFPMV